MIQRSHSGTEPPKGEIMVWIVVILGAFVALVVILVVFALIRVRFFYPHKRFLRELREALGPGCRIRFRKSYPPGPRGIPGIEFQRDGASFFVGVIEAHPLDRPGPNFFRRYESIGARVLEPVSQLEVRLPVVCPFAVRFFLHHPSVKRPPAGKVGELNVGDSEMTELWGREFLTGDAEFDAHVLALSAKPEDTNDRIRRFGLFDPVRELVWLNGLGGIDIFFNKNGPGQCMCTLTDRVRVEHVRKMAEILPLL